MNMIETITKEINKGNTLVSQTGDFTSPLKVQAKMQKAYIAGAKDGTIDISKTSFNSYLKNELKKYTKTETLILDIERIISNIETEEAKESETI